MMLSPRALEQGWKEELDSNIGQHKDWITKRKLEAVFDAGLPARELEKEAWMIRNCFVVRDGRSRFVMATRWPANSHTTTAREGIKHRKLVLVYSCLFLAQYKSPGLFSIHTLFRPVIMCSVLPFYSPHANQAILCPCYEQVPTVPHAKRSLSTLIRQQPLPA